MERERAETDAIRPMSNVSPFRLNDPSHEHQQAAAA